MPKRLARRAVTRNLVKRQARVAFGGHALRLPPGDWVVRLRAPIDTAVFVSAASVRLRAVLREELARLFADAAAGRGAPAAGKRRERA